MLVRSLAVSVVVLAGCASAAPPLATPVAHTPVTMSVPDSAAAVVSRRHRVARRLSPPFLASSSLRHVVASETGTTLVSTDYDAVR